MKKEKFYQKLAAGAAWLLAVALLLPVCVGAGTTENVDTSKKDCSITINFEKGSTDFHLYRVASIDEQTKFTLVDPFTNYSVKVNDLDASGYSGLALTLANYASADSLTPTAEGTTDQNGTYTFSNLETGMYLLTGETLTVAGTDSDGTAGTYAYTPTASIVVVPTWETPTDGGDLVYNYNPTVTVKYAEQFVPDDLPLDAEELKVVKVWDYSGMTKKEKKVAKQDQPTEITVSILQDGTVYSDESGTDYSNIKLNAENSWTWKKDDLPGGYTYSAIENTDDDAYGDAYTVTTSQTSNVVTLTNTHKTSNDKYDEDEDTTATTAGSTSNTSSSSSSSSTTKLPQTGQLWWPVPILALAGLVLFGAGSIRRSRSGKKEK